MLTNLGRNRCCDIPSPLKGDRGDKGVGGIIGDIGIIGTTGPTGSIGPTGVCYRGPQGQKGPQGPQDGITGPTGTPGSYIINYNSNFSTSPGSTYNNSGYRTLGSNNIILPLSEQKWAISWEIVEKWQDSGNNFYVRLNEYYNPGTYHYPNTFSNSHPCFLYSGDSNTSMYGSGNDYLDLTGSSETDFVIELRQKTTSGSTISVSGSLIFNITFTQII